MRYALVVGLFSFAVACGDDDGGSGDDGDDVADDGDDTADDGSDTTLDELSADDAAEICAATTDLVSAEAFVEFSCYFAGLLAAEEGADCETFAQDCIDGTEPIDEVTTCYIDPELYDIPDCASEITVGEIEACLDAIADQFLAIFDINCDTSLDDVFDPEDLATLELPDECLALEDICPDLFNPPT